MLGTVARTEDGRYAVRFERRLAHAPAKVWRALTETAQLQGWFVEILDYERSDLHFGEGAELTFVAKPEHDLPVGHGEVTRFEPPRLLEYTWDTEILRWELEPDGDTGCRLCFTNVLDDRGTAVTVAPGWHAGLDSLAAFLDGRQVDWSGWEQLQEDYARALG